MPVLDKKLLLSAFEERWNEYVPANMVRKIIADAGEVLTGYEVSSNPVFGRAIRDESKQLVRLFIDAKAIEGKSQNTLDRYEYILGRLIEAVNVPLDKVTVYHIRQYMMAEKNRGVCMNTIKSNCYVYQSFYGWLHAEGIIQSDPTANIGTIKATRDEEPPFTSEEIQLIKEAAGNDLERAVIHFLLATGCRVSELCSVNRQDLDFQNLCLKVHGKGDKYRMVYFDDVTAMMLRRYLSTRTDIDPALFYGRMRKRLEPSGIQMMLRRIGKRAHVPGVHPHRFRHTFATGLVDRGMEVQYVSALLGHAKLDTTMGYVHQNERNAENSYRKYAV